MMATETIKKELIELIFELFRDKGFDVDVIEYVDFVDDLGMDSMIFISTIVEIETKFNITIPDNLLLMDNFRKVEQITGIINQLICNHETINLREVSNDK